ncbi:MAG TPA: hypothetical protein VEK37_09410 [Gemmatimonadaceae bacterium]|nr:hypothetical protein [Gemmatimonadaceae bacterium]
MKFFTREWHAGEVSESEANTIPAAYQADIEGLLSKMPVAVRALAQSINVHDGRIRRVTPRSLEIYSNRRAAMRRHREGYFDIDLSYGDVDVSASDLHSLEVVGGQSKAEVLYDEIGPTWRK